MLRTRKHTALPPPYLRQIWIDQDKAVDRESFPFCLHLYRDEGFELGFDRPVTIIVGENGTDKSTLLEGITVPAGFPEMRGGLGYLTDSVQRVSAKEGGALLPALRGA